MKSNHFVGEDGLNCKALMVVDKTKKASKTFLLFFFVLLLNIIAHCCCRLTHKNLFNLTIVCRLDVMTQLLFCVQSLLHVPNLRCCMQRTLHFSVFSSGTEASLIMPYRETLHSIGPSFSSQVLSAGPVTTHANQ